MGVHPTHRQLKTSGLATLTPASSSIPQPAPAAQDRRNTARASRVRLTPQMEDRRTSSSICPRRLRERTRSLYSTSRSASLVESVWSRNAAIRSRQATFGWRPQIHGLPSRSRRGVPDNGSAMLPTNRARSSRRRSRSVAFRLGQNNDDGGHGEGGGANLQKLAARRLIFLHRTFLLWLTGNLVFDDRVNSTIPAPRASANNPKPKFGNAETCRPVPLKADAEDRSMLRFSGA
jgi:hypothetical protein